VQKIKQAQTKRVSSHLKLKMVNSGSGVILESEQPLEMQHGAVSYTTTKSFIEDTPYQTLKLKLKKLKLLHHNLRVVV